MLVKLFLISNLFIFKILLPGTQIAFEYYLSVQNLRENLSPLLKVYLYALKAFQMSIEILSHLLKAKRVTIPFVKFQYIHLTIGKKGTQICKGI